MSYYEINKVRIQAQQRLYRQSNLEKERERNRSYRQLKHKELKVYQQEYHKTHKIEINNYRQIYRENNKQKIAEQLALRYVKRKTVKLLNRFILRHLLRTIQYFHNPIFFFHSSSMSAKKCSYCRLQIGQTFWFKLDSHT